MAEEGRNLDFRQREVVLRADFNDLDDDRCLWTSLRFILQGPRAPREGEWVYLLDVTGSGCFGQVESISGWTARVKPDWSSWTSDRPRPV
jgi:hypothetical protein